MSPSVIPSPPMPSSAGAASRVSGRVTLSNVTSFTAWIGTTRQLSDSLATKE